MKMLRCGSLTIRGVVLNRDTRTSFWDYVGPFEGLRLRPDEVFGEVFE